MRKVEAICGIEFDLFKLHVDDDLKRPGWAWISVKGVDLLQKLRLIIAEILVKNVTRWALSKMVAKGLKCSPYTICFHIRGIEKNRREWVALPIIISILDIWGKVCKKSNSEKASIKRELQDSFELVRGSAISRPMPAVKHLTIDLCKIAGAHAADGSISKRYLQITLDDSDKNALLAYTRWIKGCFNVNVKLKPRKTKNHYRITFYNKIIVRYLHQLLGFPYGEKSDIVEEPHLIRQAPLEFRQAFVTEVMTFDGYVQSNGVVGIDLNSPHLIRSVFDVLQELCLRLTLMNMNGRYRIRTQTLSDANAKRCVTIFEQGTEKWSKIIDIVEGFTAGVKSVEDAILVLESVYKIQNGSKISIGDILRLASQLKVFDINSMYNELSAHLQVGISKDWIYTYLKILKNANIIRTIDGDQLLKVWRKLNPSKTFLGLDENALAGLRRNLITNTNSKSLNMVLHKLEEPMLYDWLNRKCRISLVKLRKLADVANMNFNDLLFGAKSLKSDTKVFIFNQNIGEWVVPLRPCVNAG